MKITLYLKQFMLVMLTFFISCILSACGSGGLSSSSNNSGQVRLGTLPNGSTVYTSISTFPVSDGSSVSAELSLVGGTPGSSFKISFGDSVLQGVQKKSTGARLQNTDSNGITITPRFCVLGTAGSGESTSCTYSVTASENTAPGTYTVTPSVLVNDEVIQTLNPITVLVSATLSPSSRSITSYSLNGTAGVITGQNIAVTMPYGTNLSALTATYITTGKSVAVGSTIQINGSTTNDFSSPVTYTVTAENGLTKDYTVTVTVASNSAKAITAFSFGDYTGIIIGHTISVTVPYGTLTSSLVANFTISGENATIAGVPQVTGVTTNDFTNPVTYTVHAADGTTQDYTVAVTVATNSAKSIITFALNGVAGTISGQNITVIMPYGTDVSALTAAFDITGENVTVASTLQNNGVTQNDFTNPVVYTVHAADGTAQNYTVTVIVASNSAKGITAFSLGGSPGVIIGQNIYVTMPYGTDVSALGATFNTSGASVTVNGVTQVNNGATPNDFTAPVIYTVHAANGTTQDYTVTVTLAANTAKAITTFSLGGTPGLVIGQNIAVTMPFGTNVSALGASFTTNGVNVTVNGVTQVNNGATPNDFTTPVVYTVHAADGTTQNYTVAVTVALSPDKNMIAFSLGGTSGLIIGQNIAVTMPFGTDVSALPASFIINGTNVTVGTITQDNGVTTHNFATPVVYTVHAADGSTQNYTVTVTVALSPYKSITAFTLNGVSGVITGQGIAVIMPYGTDVSALGASFNTSGESVTVNSVIQVNSGATPNDFTNPVVYTVHAADGTTQDYIVTVTVALSPDKALTEFSLGGTAGVITGTNISVTMPYGTNVSALSASFITDGASVTVSGVTQVNNGGTSNNFAAPVVYTVHAADGTTQDYTVTVTVALNSAKDMLSFALNGTAGTITGQNIAVIMPYGTTAANINSLIASFITSGDRVTVAGVNQVTTVTANNFTAPVVYTVHAADGTTQNYTVTVTVAPPDKTITSFALNGLVGMISGQNITVIMPYGTNVTALIATFTTTGASVSVNSTVQDSGVTPNNFTSPVVYTVTAENGSTQNYNVSVVVSEVSNIVSAGDNVCYINGSNGLTYCWGRNNFGQLGDGTTTNSSIPVAVTLPSGITSFVQLWTANGYDDSASCAIDSNGLAYCWGKNDRGQLGNGTTSNSSVPVAVTLPSGVTSFTYISTAGRASCGIGNNGRAYCWGSNDQGQFGNGTLTSSLTPVPVNLPSGVTSFTSISQNTNFSCGIGDNGLAYCWGFNDYGQLGNGTTTRSLVPVAVTLPSGVTSFSQISATQDDAAKNACAIGNNGLAYCWGKNQYGQLGNGTTTNSSVPVAVTLPSGVTSFRRISSGGDMNCAIGDNGRAYCWGLNNYGQLGNGTTTNSSVPVAVTLPSGVTSFITVDAGGTDDGSSYTSCGVGDNGLAYCWGRNNFGQLGNGTTTNSSIPVAVSM